MTLDPTLLSNLVLIAAGFAAAFLAALWLSLLIWTYRDIRGRVRDPLMRILAVLVAAVLFLPGVLVYLILRPARTLEEEYQRTLEEEALLQSIEENSLCPGCSRRVREDWVACPTCHTRLKKYCPVCNRSIDLAWNLCPYCGTPAPGVPTLTLPVSATASSTETAPEGPPAELSAPAAAPSGDLVGPL